MRHLLLFLLLFTLGASASPMPQPVTVVATSEPKVYGFLATDGLRLVELRVVKITPPALSLKIEDFGGKVLFNAKPSAGQRLPVAGPGVRLYAVGSGGSVVLQPRFAK